MPTTYRRKYDRRYKSKAVTRKKKVARKKKGLAPLPQRDYMAKAEIGKSIGFPKSKSTVMKYVDRVPITNTLGALNGYKFRANGVWDANYTSTGHQPYTFDQWSLFYNHYLVTKSRIKVTAVGNNLAPIIIGIYLSDDATILGNVEGLVESGRGSSAVLPLDVSSKVILYADYDAKQFFNKNADISEIGADVTSDPAEEAIFSVWSECLNQAGITESPETLFLIEIDYHVTFYEPKDLATS